ncbi:UDP-N-acetylmuramoyl-tripeptide--D-alanyl-D-alanine ligase [Acinetobacter calcoaceticus]|uniref:UDP-N-acetylmuramoyl-tripeptide--D-alanyl-D-alanine ligase n=1 Tax=Acinetobacter calcoaceticus TaxID=471 RepID=A0A4R1Y2P2_ACICA|nr:UDP-N-acetylmuramoyl-tripeptide--D-alanyl-D-alanine ligase [Acinetobacter calcoaceticus]
MHTSTTSTAILEPWTAEQLLQATQGYWHLDRRPDAEIKRILTDSRHAESGDAFLALKGERFDAHDFVAQVVAQGCQVVIVSRPLDVMDQDVFQLVVSDTRLALGQLGAYRRSQHPHLKVIALTGSSGKTTVKEMLYSILSQRAATLVTRGNLNNDLGVPMMLLELRAEHQYAVMELGANHQGEIDYTAQLVQPDVAGILNIGTAHLGEFGGRDGICRAKSEIYAHINAQGTAIVPADDAYFRQISAAIQSPHRLSFGQGGDVYATQIQLHAQSTSFVLNSPQGQHALELPFAGLHNVHNATAAAAFALAIGIDINDIIVGLAKAQGAKGRLNFIQKNNILFIDDTYNANPSSMRAAAQVLTQQAGVRVMVLGDIGELGDAALLEHHDLGRDLAQLPIEYVIPVGEFAASTASGDATQKIRAYATQAEALIDLLKLTEKHQPQSMSFLFKGSRSTHMETLMADLMEKI